MPFDERAYRMAVNLARRGEMQSARRLLQDMIEKHDDDEQTWVWLAATYASEETRLRILQAGLQRFPQGELLQKAFELLQRRIEQKQIRLAEAEKPAEQLESAALSSEQAQPAVPDPQSSAENGPAIEGEPPPPRRVRENDGDLWKVALAVAVVVLTIITAYLWTQLR